MTITTFDKGNCDLVQREMLDACRAIADKHNLAIEANGFKYDRGGRYFLPEFKVATKTPTGAAFSPDAELFKSCASTWGLKPEDLGRVFTSRGQRYKIIGAKSGAWKYPILCEQTGSGRVFKFPASAVLSGLSALTATKPTIAEPKLPDPPPIDTMPNWKGAKSDDTPPASSKPSVKPKGAMAGSW
jgi:hypothetical protein